MSAGPLPGTNATRAAGPSDGPVVGVSVSESPDDELVMLGLSTLHLRHAFIEAVRHVLAAGWAVAYGGDLRRSGYTEALFDLVRMYEPRGRAGPDRVVSYLAWPAWVGRRPEDDAELANVTTLVRCPPPPGAPDDLPPGPQRSAVDLHLGSLAYTAMRRTMTAGIDCRLVLGGRVSGQLSLLPGVAEEALLAIEAGLPLYVAGGFGGCGRVLAAALDGEAVPELTVDYQLDNTPRYRELLDVARRHGAAPDFDAIVATLGATGMTGLRNGLDEDDNRRLARTDDVEEMVTLVLRGLNRCFGSPGV